MSVGEVPRVAFDGLRPATPSRAGPCKLQSPSPAGVASARFSIGRHGTAAALPRGMADLVLVLVTVGFFALATLFVRALDRG